MIFTLSYRCTCTPWLPWGRISTSYAISTIINSNTFIIVFQKRSAHKWLKWLFFLLQVFTRRWFMAILFATYSLSNAYQWIHLNIIGNIILKFYNESLPGTPYQQQVSFVLIFIHRLHTSPLQWRHNGRNSVSDTSLMIVYSIVYSDADQRKHQSSASLAFVRGIHRWPVHSPHKWPVTRKIFPFGDVVMQLSDKIGSHRCVAVFVSIM